MTLTRYWVRCSKSCLTTDIFLGWVCEKTVPKEVATLCWWKARLRAKRRALARARAHPCTRLHSAVQHKACTKVRISADNHLYPKLPFLAQKYSWKVVLKKYFWNSSMRKPFSSNLFYLLVLRKITNSVTKITIFLHGRKSEIFFLPYVLDLIHLLEQKFCPDSNLRVKTMYEPVK